MKNKLRIIGGDWRSRQLSFVDTPGLRPTPARVRETLFNWLQYEIVGKCCLDLYAGSGALGFEAASRGAKSVIQVENNVQACRCLKDNAVALSVDDCQGGRKCRNRHDYLDAGGRATHGAVAEGTDATQIKIVQSDVLRYLAGDALAFDVVFLDPPFGLKLAVQTCRQLEENGWLAKQAKIYVETERHFDFSGMPENWRQLKSKSAGEVGYHLFERA